MELGSSHTIRLAQLGRRENYQIAGDDDTAIAEHVIEWADNSALPLIVFSSPWRPFSGEWRNLIVWDKGEGVGGGATRPCALSGHGS
jgi:hypothetical protein